MVEPGVTVVEPVVATLPTPLLIETLVAPGEWLVTYMQDGRQYGTLRKVVSADGKTMRETFKGTVQGQSLEIAVVVDRQ